MHTGAAIGLIRRGVVWRTTILRVAVSACAMLAAGVQAQADTFPSRPVSIVVPFTAGGAVDSVARVVADPLSKLLGQPVLVNNKPGDQANIGTYDVVRAPADGYTLLLGANGLATNPWLNKKLPFAPLRDLAPVARVGYAPLVLVVPSASPYKTLSQFIQGAKSKKGAMNYGSAAVGGSGHLAGELLKREAGFQAQHVPYKGGAPALTDLIGGRLDFMMINPLEAAPHVTAGKLRALAVAAPARIASLPQVPTFTQAGLKGFEATVWWGFLVPAKTPAPIVALLSRDILHVLDDAGVRQRLARLGAVVDPQGPEQFGKFLRSETQRWGDVIHSAGITAN